MAFFVAAFLVLEYGISASAVAVGWSEYVGKLVTNVTGWVMPYNLTHAPLTVDPDNPYALTFGGEGAGLFNLPAVVLVFMCAILLIRGSRESVKANTIMVLIKLSVLTMFVAIAGSGFKAGNLVPFAPHGFTGIGQAAGAIFFTFVGLDAVCTAGEEVVNPKRNLPLGIILALIIVIIFYALVAMAALGVQPADKFGGQEAGLAVILENATGAQWPANILAGGAVISIFSVTLVSLYGQTRVLFAMSRDGMLPEFLHQVNPRTMTPIGCTVVVTLFVAAIAAVVPADVLWDLTSMGTLVAFTVVSLGVMILRRRNGGAGDGFKVPFYPALPILSVISCLYLISQLHLIVFELTAVWLVIAGAIYFAYSVRHSRLEHPHG